MHSKANPACLRNMPARDEPKARKRSIDRLEPVGSEDSSFVGKATPVVAARGARAEATSSRRPSLIFALVPIAIQWFPPYGFRDAVALPSAGRRLRHERSIRGEKRNYVNFAAGLNGCGRGWYLTMENPRGTSFPGES